MFIIGGGHRPVYLMNQFIKLAGGFDSKILIIPAASKSPFETGLALKTEFNSLGCSNVDYLITSGDNSDDIFNLKKLHGVRALFFSGGDQNKLARHFLGTRLLREIREMYKSGLVIGGTSAGAAIMSSIMLTSFKNDDSDEILTLEAETANAVLSKGFGFLDHVIVDQHFNTRPRHLRLMNAVRKHPEKTGIGIDESTALVVKPDGSWEVAGENKITVYSASELAQDTKVSLRDINVKYCFPGEVLSKCEL